jgi:hypothetical protein
METTSKHCKTCGGRRAAHRRPVNHVLHLLISVFLCGLWLPVWACLALFRWGGWKCSSCGGKV